MPIGVFTGLFALLAVATLASGLYLLVHARAVAREVSRLDNDIVAGPQTRRTHGPRVPVRIVGIVFAASMTGLAAFIVLYVTRVIGPEAVQSHPASVQRP